MDIKTVITVIAILLLVATYLRYTRQVAAAFLTAFIVSLLWTMVYRYEYVGDNMLLFDQINVYPLSLWTLGLTWLYLAHTQLKMFRHPFAVVLLHLTVLAVIEVTGYYLLNIRLVGNFTSLLGIGVIHAPLLAKTFYLVAGPLYIFAIDAYKKRHHRFRNSIKAALASI